MNSEQIEELFESANQNKYSYVLMLPLGDACIRTTHRKLVSRTCKPG